LLFFVPRSSNGYSIGAQQQNNRHGGNQRSGFRQQNHVKKEKATAEDLDADLEAYRAESASKK